MNEEKRANSPPKVDIKGCRTLLISEGDKMIKQRSPIVQGLSLYLNLPLAREANIPPVQKRPNRIKAVLVLIRNAGKFAGAICALPIWIANISMAIPMLNICPVILIVARVPDATP
jgi:hypothetical protein